MEPGQCYVNSVDICFQKEQRRKCNYEHRLLLDNELTLVLASIIDRLNSCGFITGRSETDWLLNTLPGSSVRSELDGENNDCIP